MAHTSTNQPRVQTRPLGNTTKEGGVDWTDVTWVPVARQLPTPDDGPLYADGAKVEVLVLTVGMMLSGHEPERRGFHLQARSFDDDDDGRAKVMFWAPVSCDLPAEFA